MNDLKYRSKCNYYKNYKIIYCIIKFGTKIALLLLVIKYTGKVK